MQGDRGKGGKDTATCGKTILYTDTTRTVEGHKGGKEKSKGVGAEQNGSQVGEKGRRHRNTERGR